MKRIAIQGVRACFHDVAARKYFKNESLSMVECDSFPKLCRSLEEKHSDFAIMAIENTIAGSILPNYALLEAHGFKILGETYLRIEMCIMALPDQKIEEIRFVKSHPMAILQCQDFLEKHPDIQVVEGSDTAESALEIGRDQKKQYAAIASKLAAETYGLNLLAENIETNRSNYTRFLILSRAEDYQKPAGANKASVVFEASHEPGSLARLLTMLGSYGVNLTKIQSMPILGRPYQYAFHVDLEWKDESKYQEALKQLQSQTSRLLHFGEYLSGEKPVL